MQVGRHTLVTCRAEETRSSLDLSDSCAVSEAEAHCCRQAGIHSSAAHAKSSHTPTPAWKKADHVWVVFNVYFAQLFHSKSIQWLSTTHYYTVAP